IVGGLCAFDGQSAVSAGVEAKGEQVERALVNAGALLSDLKFPIQLEQMEIVGGNIAYQRQDHGAADVLLGEKVCLRRFRCMLDTSPDIELPRGVQQSPKVPIVYAARSPGERSDFVLAATKGFVADLRLCLRLHDADERACLFDFRDR